METQKTKNLLLQIEELQNRLAEALPFVSDLTVRKQAINELEAKKNWQNIFQHVPAATAIFEGPELKCILANKAYVKLTNRKAEALLGEKFRDIFPELKGTGTYELYDHVFETGEPFIAPEYAAMVDIRNDGVLRQGYFNFSMEPLKNDTGEVYAVLTMTYDITEQVEAKKKIEENESLLRLALFLTAKTVFKQDTQLRYTWVYNTHPKFRSKEIIGKTDHDVLNKDAANILTTIKQSVLNTGKTFSGDIQIEIEGKPVDFALIVEATKDIDGKINGIIAVTDDISERKQFENKIKESEKQKAFLLKISDAIRHLSKPEEIEEKGTKIALEFMDADRCYYNTIEDGNAIVLRDAFRDGLSSLAGVYPISNFPLFKVVVDAGSPFVVDDVHTSDIIEEGLRQICVQVQVISMINIPFIKGGKTVGMFSLVQSKPRKWTEVEVQLTIETAERTWASMERAKAEEVLHISEEKYRTLFTSIDQGFTLCELIRNKEGKAIDLCILEVNPTYEKQTGVTKEMVLGKPLLQVFPSLGKWIEIYAAVVDNQCPVEFVQYFKDTDRWFAIKAYPVAKEKFAVLFNDITERKKAEEKLIESEGRFRNLAETLPQMVWVMNGDGQMEYGSKNWKEYSGIDDVAEAWNYMMHPDDRERVTAYWKRVFAQGKGFHHELRLKNKEGVYRWFYSVGEPVLDADGKIRNWVGSLTDIHEQKNIEQLLEIKVAVRTIELEEKNTELQNMNKELEAFTYICSHDLQEPLRKIQTFTGRILDTEKENLSETGKDYFFRTNKAAERMRILIQDLLSFSSLNTTDRIFEITDLNKIVDEVKTEFNELIYKNNATIISGEMCAVKIIPFQFRQLMQNLIGNALKFSKANTPPYIVIKSEIITAPNSPFGEKEACHISVSDNGIGFEKQFSERIFQVFQKLHGKDEYAGTGIGLAIVKKIVDNHHGIISAESEFGKGATFNIYIPVW